MVRSIGLFHFSNVSKLLFLPSVEVFFWVGLFGRFRRIVVALKEPKRPVPRGSRCHLYSTPSGGSSGEYPGPRGWLPPPLLLPLPPRDGAVSLFDTSFLHAAVNDADEDRYVLPLAPHHTGTLWYPAAPSCRQETPTPSLNQSASTGGHNDGVIVVIILIPQFIQFAFPVSPVPSLWDIRR